MEGLTMTIVWVSLSWIIRIEGLTISWIRIWTVAGVEKNKGLPPPGARPQTFHVCFGETLRTSPHRFYNGYRILWESLPKCRISTKIIQC